MKLNKKLLTTTKQNNQKKIHIIEKIYNYNNNNCENKIILQNTDDISKSKKI